MWFGHFSIFDAYLPGQAGSYLSTSRQRQNLDNAWKQLRLMVLRLLLWSVKEVVVEAVAGGEECKLQKASRNEVEQIMLCVMDRYRTKCLQTGS